MIAYVWLLLLAYDRLKRSVTSRTIKSYECESSSSTVQASSHFDHTSLLPSFIALDQPSNIAWLGSDLNCGNREVDEVVPIALF